MFDSLLVANRGEIAVRIFRTARQLGISCIAVHSDADQHGLHVRHADQSVRLGPATPAESYLHIDRILAAAKSTGAAAIHPGYGFLAENAEFASRVRDAGLVFIGPSADAMRAVGDKATARQRMSAIGIPVIPGVESLQTPEEFTVAAAQIGYPIMLKAAAGGGGRGMRRVATETELTTAIATCQREAMAAFGDDRLLMERCVDHARHIEVQIIADAHGNVVHLFTRDCSAQRRHQKILEEAPANNLSPPLTEQLHTAAIHIARAVGYVNAGTVEFLVPVNPTTTETFYFLEMNARLQVEHPITEAITGVDLVEWQLRVAAGEALPRGQGEIHATGHAIEARLCAEDPAEDFRPAPGKLHHLTLPPASADLRVDSGVVAGDVIPPNYDSMIAKLITHGVDRPTALEKLQSALATTVIVGPPTNRQLLQEVLATAEFRAGEYSTELVTHTVQESFAHPPQVPPQVLAAVAVDAHLVGATARQPARGQRGDPNSPFALADGWRIGDPATWTVHLHEHANTHEIKLSYRHPHWLATVGDDRESPIDFEATRLQESEYSLRSGEQVQVVLVTRIGSSCWQVRTAQRTWLVDAFAPDAFEFDDEGAGGDLRAPLPGRLLRYHVAVGDVVEPGAALVTIEAMKTEHTIRAPNAGRIAALAFAAGDLVDEGVSLLSVETETTP